MQRTASRLASFKGGLILDGLETIDKDVARELAGFKGHLGLDGLGSIDGGAELNSAFLRRLELDFS